MPEKWNTWPRYMLALLLAVFYFVAVVLNQTQKLTIMAGHVLKCEKRVFGIPDFKYDALRDGLSNIFSRFPGKLQKQTQIRQSQLSLGLIKSWGMSNIRNPDLWSGGSWFHVFDRSAFQIGYQISRLLISPDNS